jgi:hypothetical protein
VNRRPLFVVLGVLAFLLVGILAKGLSVVVLGDSDVGEPPTSELLPVPDGTAIVVDKAFPGEGSLGAGQRLLVLDTAKGSQSAPQATLSYVEGLHSRGWTSTDPTAALSPDSGICLTAVPMIDYLADADRPETTKQLLRDLGRPADSIGAITAIFC